MFRALQRLPQRPPVLVDGNLPFGCGGLSAHGDRRGQPISGHCCGECSGQERPEMHSSGAYRLASLVTASSAMRAMARRNIVRA